MRRRRLDRAFTGGFLLLLLGALTWLGLRWAGVWPDATVDDAHMSDEERAMLTAFEDRVQRDSIRKAQYWDSAHAAWAEQKAQRQLARAKREAAYADSQRVWAERRARWALEKEERALAAADRKALYDSIVRTRIEKLPRGSVIDANMADTLLLRRIPGIGEVNARKILAYRQALGGFVSSRQLDEIEGLPHGISAWFVINERDAAQHLRRLNINRADFKTLVHHPYLTYEQTKAIMNLRQRTGRVRSFNDLRGSGLFTDDDFQRLTPYIVF